MILYFFYLFLSFVILIGITANVWHSYNRGKKAEDSYKVPIKEILTVIVILSSGIVFVHLLSELPNALAYYAE